MHIEHIGLWVRDLERMRDFYTTWFNGQAGPLYENPHKGFRSYFIAFANGARLELMHQTDQKTSETKRSTFGYAHLGFRLTDEAAVDETVKKMQATGHFIAGQPRTTGDGYYEAVVEDPEGNLLELIGGQPDRLQPSSLC